MLKSSKMIKINLFVLGVILIYLINLSSAAHFVVGIVNDSLDGTIADGHTIFLWNPLNGFYDNLTDIVGTSGNSGVNNIYMLDCEMLNSSCEVGDILYLKIIDNGDGYNSKVENVTITGAGFDTVPDIILNSPPIFLNISIEDDIIVPNDEIDLNAGSTKYVKCSAFLSDYDNDSISILNGVLYDSVSSSYLGAESNETNYRNNSCSSNSNLGGDITYVECGFSIWYYANSSNWNCTLKVGDSLNSTKYGSNLTKINKLLAFSLPDSIDYGEVSSLSVSSEIIANVTNFGNSLLNLSLEGYAVNRGDNLSMNCSQGPNKNISIDYEKYNLTQSNAGIMTLAEFEAAYANLSSIESIRNFNLGYRTDEYFDNAVKPTYWRMYVPTGVAGNCSGNIIFGARAVAEG